MSYPRLEYTSGVGHISSSGCLPIPLLSDRIGWTRGAAQIYRWNFDEAPTEIVRYYSPYQIRMDSTGSRIFEADLAELAMRFNVLAAPTSVTCDFDLMRSSVQWSSVPYFTIISHSHNQSREAFRPQLRAIQSALALSISDVASALGVSRQAVYKWLSGGPISEMNQERFDDLYRAANLVSSLRGPRTLGLGKRRNSRGMTLLHAMQSGDSARNWVEEVWGASQNEGVQRKMLVQQQSLEKRRVSALHEFGVPLRKNREPIFPELLLDRCQI